MTERKVQCVKLGEELPGLEKPPFPGETGDKIYEKVSANAWAMWQDMQIKIINEYRLNLGDKKDYETLIKQMLLFLNLEDGEAAEVENAERGKGE